MKKNFTFFFFLLLLYNNSFGQPGLSINAGTSFFITAGTTVSMEGLALQPSSAFTINAPNTLQRATTIAHTAPQAYISRVYQWSNTTSPYSGTIAVYYQDAELNGIAETDLTLNIHNGTNWAPFAGGTVRDASNNIVTTTVSNIALNELTLAALPAPLPLTWGPVKAYRKNEAGFVEWKTYNEVNASHFEIERSTDGTSWEIIGYMMATNGSDMNNYSFKDITAPSGKVYYRIKQVDQDPRHFSYSPIVSLSAIADKEEIQVYPNPVTDLVNIRLKNNSASLQYVSLYTTDGKWVKTEKKNNNNNIYQFNMAGLPSGVYWIKLLFENGGTNIYSILKK